MGEERERVCMCVPYLLIKIEIRTQYTHSLSLLQFENKPPYTIQKPSRKKNLQLPSSSNEISLVSKDLTKVSSLSLCEFL